MKGFLKLLLGLVGTVVLLVVIAAIALPLIYDTEDLKRLLAQEMQEQTGRELQIDGPLDFSVFPWLAIEVQELSLGNAPGFGERPFAKIGEARVGVALVPLFRKQIAVDEVVLDGLELALTVNAQGINNWDDLSGTGDASGQPDTAEVTTFSSRRIAGLNIRDAEIEFNDQSTGDHYRLSDFSMKTGPIGDGKPLPFELSALFEDLAAGSVTDVTFAATATLDLEQKRYAFEQAEFSLNPRQADGDSGAAAIRIESPRMVADMAAQTLDMEQFSLNLASLSASGNLSAKQIVDKPAFQGSITIREFSPRALMRELKMEPIATTDADALGRVTVQTTFTGDGTSLHLPDLDMNLDQSRISGDVKVRNFNQPRIGFMLNVDQIDIDRYLAPSEQSSSSDEVAIPREELRGQEVEGMLNIGLLHMAGMELTDATLGINIRGGRLRLNPLTAGFYGGKYNGDITVDSSGEVPEISIDETIDSVAFQRLLGDLVDGESLSGLAQGRLKLNGRGNNSNEVLGSLNGELGLNLSDGALEGINIWHEIRKGMAQYKGLPAPPAEPNRTVFSRLQLDALVNNGVANTRQMVAELPFLTLTGKGAVDLGQSLVDLRLVAAVRNVPELANDPLTAELKGKQLPFRVSGAMDDPKIMLDFGELLKTEAAGRLLDKLLGTKEPEKGDQAATPSDPAPGDDDVSPAAEEQSSEDELKESAAGALFQLLQGSKKDKDEEEKEGNL